MSWADRRDGRLVRCVVGVVLLIVLEGLASAQPAASRRFRRPFAPPGGRRSYRSAVAPVEIDNGFVICQGQYVAPPYVVESDGQQVTVNGYDLAQTRSRGSRRFPGGGGRPAGRGGSQEVLGVEQHLRNEGLLIRPEGGELLYLSAEKALSILGALTGDGSDTEKVQTLIQNEPAVMSSSQWIALVEAFEAPPGLVDRLAQLAERLAMLELDEPEAPLAGRMPMAGATVLGFALAVWALGTLLGCRPPTTLDSAGADITARAARQVVHLVVLIVILGAYDLVCTLFADQIGGLWELNPLARSLMARASSITTFKLTLTIGGAILLVVARRSRLAQVGSWWIGVLYTVLILRWATYNSVFMA